jgi:hypothetical protein
MMFDAKKIENNFAFDILFYFYYTLIILNPQHNQNQGY